MPNGKGRVINIPMENNVINFDSMEVSNQDREYRFDFECRPMGSIYVCAEVDNKTLTITDVSLTGINDHPNHYDTNSPHYKGHYANGLKIGIREIRRLLKRIVDTVREDYTITAISGMRVTGARTHSGDHEIVQKLSY